MKSEELQRYEDEFREMRELLGTYYLELGRQPSEAAEPDRESPNPPAPPHDPGPPPEGEPTPQAPGPEDGGA